ncbi:MULTISPECIES: bifunctional 2-keto-4-hydroxyglutarate aldolase/2-keto-3-deoxy-6-phosphogluconate aldolase [Vagococcus]|uniref:4-Hydroxy-2-oxoglutarate aldolase @ 2-dehydro-3-deoxyphosphogluconate aldolase n=1 Tax=Vagococcus fluvialis bH819 TaxID=1255619 RepID=A0A1X6WLB4_9ENTE|nr:MULTISPECIES: bifunctional 2-keto-4-hydroxyglutarate aldolase/2-keto-3-deoxy-6-phosphogluconate aldolase [Vagococcus]SLM85131.1 4-Hydroxy-2-oxoglutarate aldolase @ 2-dehydro-3-deoxyphosphogluconate aldolase [Vagococcus fluvialis bH819]HCM88454.1 bifunctional 2-keto-4-hydroxyglutarate aldolase/2-keto-3-deoxy-6-phosphogluconate aldolase [Vagococcus sp.]
MKRVNLLLKLEEAGIVAVVRSKTQKEGLLVSQSLLNNGIKAIEVTLTTPNALEIIKELREISNDDEIIIGAGTVIDENMAAIAILSGAEFIVSPVFDLEVCKLCHLYQIPYIPGCMTISEMKIALNSGVDVIKLFPSNHYEPTIISTIKSPLPQINIMPSGGVNLDNITDWLEAGALMISVGGELTKSSENVENLAKKYLEKLKEYQENK